MNSAAPSFTARAAAWLAVWEGPVAPRAKRLESADLDVAVANAASGFGDESRAERLYNERDVVIFPPGHRFAQLDAVRLADLDGAD